MHKANDKLPCFQRQTSMLYVNSQLHYGPLAEAKTKYDKHALSNSSIVE